MSKTPAHRKQKMAQKINLLIVDDSERMRRMIKSLLKGVLAEVHECSDVASP